MRHETSVRRAAMALVVALTMALAMTATPVAAGPPEKEAPELPAPRATSEDPLPAPFGYIWIDDEEPNGPVYTPVDITESGALVVAGDDEAALVELGAPFSLYGDEFAELWVTTNGLIATNTGTYTLEYLYGYCVSYQVPFEFHLILADATDLVGEVYYQYFAESPVAHPAGMPIGASIFQWQVDYYWGSDWWGGGTWEPDFSVWAILFDNDDFVVQVGPGSSNGMNDTIGVQNAAGNDSLELTCFGTRSVPDEYAVLFTANEAPEAADDAYTTGYGDLLTVAAPGVLDNDTDAKDEELTVLATTEPAHGELTMEADGAFTYLPELGFIGEDQFDYVATDGLYDSGAVVTIEVTPPPTDTVGMVDPVTGQWYLRDTADGVASFYYGDPGDYPFMGDWDCDGVETPGLYRQSDGYVYLRNSNTQGNADISFYFGDPGDTPLAGDFNGDRCDTVSLFRASEGLFYVINELGEESKGLGAADYSFLFGDPGDTPVVGDWDGDGIDEVGMFRETTGEIFCKHELSAGAADVEIRFGNPGDRFVAGDWGNVDGADTPGVFRPADGSVYLQYTLDSGFAAEWFAFGESDWMPVAGKFG